MGRRSLKWPGKRPRQSFGRGGCTGPIGAGLRMGRWRERRILKKGCGRGGRGFGMRRGSWFKKRAFTKGYPMGPRRSGIQMGKCSGEPLGVRASDMEQWRRGLPVGIGREWERMSRGREVEPLLSGGKVEKKGRRRTIKKGFRTVGGWNGRKVEHRTKKHSLKMERRVRRQVRGGS